MNRFTNTLAGLVATITFAGSTAHAATMTDLVNGATLTAADMTFSGFTYTDVGGSFGDLAVPSDGIEVTAFSSTEFVFLRFLFSPGIRLGGEEVFEVSGTFDALVQGSSRSVVSTRLTLVSGFLNGDSFYEIGQTDEPAGTLLNSYTHNSSGISSGPATPLGNLTSFTHGWDAQGEVFDSTGSVGLDAFQIRYALEGSPPPPAPIPLPAGLPLLVSGLFVMWLMRRRR